MRREHDWQNLHEGTRKFRIPTVNIECRSALLSSMWYGGLRALCTAPKRILPFTKADPEGIVAIKNVDRSDFAFVIPTNQNRGVVNLKVLGKNLLTQRPLTVVPAHQRN